MIGALKPYAEYKESGLPWLGQVPGHWTVETLRRLLRPGDGIKIGPFGSQLKLAHMSASGFKVYGQANVIASDIGRGSKYVDEAKFNELRECEVRPGDLLVTMMGTSGRCMVVPESAAAGVMDSHLLRLRLNTNGIGPVFAALTIDRAPYVNQQVAMAGKGSIMHGLNSGMVKNLAIAIPPPDEQAAIVRFLDWANGRLERAIRAKRKVIALLNEQKQAIIHRAVTRGLDPSVPLKPSGIPWLGDIPQHWEVRRLRTIVSRIDQGVSPLAVGFLAEGVSWGVLKSGCVNRGLFRETEHKQLASGFAIDPAIVVKVGDVLISRACGSPSLVGSVGRVRALRYKLILSDKTFRAVFRDLVNPDFMTFAMNSRYYRQQVEQAISGAEGMANNLPLSALRNFCFAVPPADEAGEVAAQLTAETARLDITISRLEREIELLREYRTRLVADVVTGKLDVRQAALLLPDEADEPEWPDEAEGDADEADADDTDAVPEEIEA